MKKLKKLIKENLTDTTLNINNRYVKIKAIACFWGKRKFFWYNSILWKKILLLL